MALTVTVAGTSYTIKDDGSFKIRDRQNERSQYDFVLVDTTGTATFSKGQKVSVSDSALGQLFTGVIHTATPLNLIPQPNIDWSINCTDLHYDADKRTINKAYKNQYAGNIVMDMHSSVLAAEGIVSNSAYQLNTTQADFNAGTLTNVVGSTAGDGDLELALAGTAVTFSQGPITFPSTSAIKITAVMNDANLPTTVTPQVQMKIWSGSYTVVSGDVFTFDVWIDGSSAQQIAGVDFVCTDGTQFSALGGAYTDSQFLAPIVNNQGGLLDLTGLAVNTWYTRQFQIGSLGKTIQYVSVAFYGAKPGNYTAYFRNASIFNGVTTKVTFFGPTATSFQTNPQIIQNVGYASATVSIVTAYNQSGSVTGSPVSIAAASIARSSYLSWIQTTPANETLTVVASVDGGITYLPAVNNSAIPGLLPGMSLSGKTLTLIYAFANKGGDPTVVPQFTSVAGNVQPSFVATKSDIIYSVNTQAGWNAGTLTNLTAAIPFDASGSGSTASATSLSWTHTISSSRTNTILLVVVNTGAASVSSVTYGGVALTQLSSVTESGPRLLQLWYLLSPPAGTASVVVTVGSSSFINGDSASYYSIAQSSTFGTVATNTGTGTSSTNTVTTSSTNQLVIDVIDHEIGEPDTPTSSQTLRTLSPGGGTAMGDIAATGSSMTLTWSWATSTGWGQISVAMNQTGSSLLQINGAARNWDDANFSNQTLFGTDILPADAGQLVQKKALKLVEITQFADIRSRFDFAGQFQNFTAEMDLQLGANNAGNADQSCLIYRTTAWNNTANTFAYLVIVAATKIEIGRGTNSTTNSYTTIATQSITLTVGNWYHLKVVVNGNNHQVYLNDVLYFNVTDSTFPAAGYLGARYLNNSGLAPEEVFFDNFGVVAALSGTWVSPPIDIHRLGTIQGSEIIAQIDPANASITSVKLEISLNNGSTWATCTNGATVPGLTNGTNVASMTQVLIRVTISTTSASTGLAMPDIQGITLLVMGAYSSSGVRTTVPLGNDTMVRANQSGFGTAFDGQTWAKTGTGTDAIASNEATITNTTGDVHEALGGRSWTDEEGTVRFQLSASTISAGIELRYQNSNNFYRLSASTTTLSIVSSVNGTISTLASASVSLSTGVWYWLRFRVVGNTPASLYGKVWADGTLEPGVVNGVLSSTSPMWTVQGTN